MSADHARFAAGGYVSPPGSKDVGNDKAIRGPSGGAASLHQGHASGGRRHRKRSQAERPVNGYDKWIIHGGVQHLSQAASGKSLAGAARPGNVGLKRGRRRGEWPNRLCAKRPEAGVPGRGVEEQMGFGKGSTDADRLFKCLASA